MGHRESENTWGVNSARLLWWEKRLSPSMNRTPSLSRGQARPFAMPLLDPPFAFAPCTRRISVLFLVRPSTGLVSEGTTAVLRNQDTLSMAYGSHDRNGNVYMSTPPPIIQ